MATLSTTVLTQLAWEWDNNCGYASAVLSGIVGDKAHARSGGYHISIEDQVNPSNYSVVRPDDKAPPGNWPRNRAAAIDMSMNTPDMVKCWERVYKVWQNRHIDPRAKYFNAFNGWNGIGKAERLDFVTGARTITTDDHRWHCHDETRRKYVNDLEMKRAKLSVFRGESIQEYLGQGQTPEPKPLVKRRKFVEYLWVNTDSGTPKWAVERPYLAGTGSPLAWEELGSDEVMAVNVGMFNGFSNRFLNDKQWAKRKAAYTS